MNDMRTDEPPEPPQNGQGRRLDSWKKIAAHFRRDVTTVQRWERREGMPIHRHLHSKQGSVYAFPAELDAWWESRRGRLPESEDGGVEAGAGAASVDEPPAAAPRSPSATPATSRRRVALRRMTGWLLAGIAVAALLYAVLGPAHRGTQPWRNPLGNATFTRLTDWPGVE